MQTLVGTGIARLSLEDLKGSLERGVQCQSRVLGQSHPARKAPESLHLHVNMSTLKGAGQIRTATGMLQAASLDQQSPVHVAVKDCAEADSWTRLHALDVRAQVMNNLVGPDLSNGQAPLCRFQLPA